MNKHDFYTLNTALTKQFIFIALFGLFSLQVAVGQERIASIPVKAARLMTTDELGNVYVVNGENALIRFNEQGDSTGSFRSIQNGDLLWVDASNPLRILLSYPHFSKIMLLDNMLAPKNELDLKKLRIYTAPAVGMSADGRLWVYDYNQARLRKINDQLEQDSESNDLRMEADAVPRPQSLIEQNGKVYLCDSIQGIFTFDRFGNYLSRLLMLGVGKIQVIGSQLLYFDGNAIQLYDTKSLQAGAFALPDTRQLLDARMGRNRLYLLFPDKLDIYQTE